MADTQLLRIVEFVGDAVFVAAPDRRRMYGDPLRSVTFVRDLLKAFYADDTTWLVGYIYLQQHGDRNLIVIDGMQRLVTLCLVLRVLSEALPALQSIICLPNGTPRFFIKESLMPLFSHLLTSSLPLAEAFATDDTERRALLATYEAVREGLRAAPLGILARWLMEHATVLVTRSKHAELMQLMACTASGSTAAIDSALHEELELLRRENANLKRAQRQVTCSGACMLR